MRVSLLLAALAAVLFALSLDASAAVTTKRVHSDVAGGDFDVSTDFGPISADYSAETASGVPLTDSYAVERGADAGLVRLMSQSGRRALRYVIPSRLIRAIVKVRSDGDIFDRLDLVFVPEHLMVIHTTAENAGIFISSDVYDLPCDKGHALDSTPLREDKALLQMFEIGYSFSGPFKETCGS